MSAWPDPHDTSGLPLHELTETEFARYTAQHWNRVFEHLREHRTFRGAPFWTNSASTSGGRA